MIHPRHYRDTGYRYVPNGHDEDDMPHCPAFKEIGERIGPFDFSMIPIGAYSPRWFMSPIHCSPEDAVRVHEDIKSKRSVGMHWGTVRDLKLFPHFDRSFLGN